MKTNLSVLFYLKKQKQDQTGLVPIYLRITVEGKRAEVTSSRSVDHEKWNAEAGRCRGTFHAWNWRVESLSR
jgi:hypothetical protein